VNVLGTGRRSVRSRSGRNSARRSSNITAWTTWTRMTRWSGRSGTSPPARQARPDRLPQRALAGDRGAPADGFQHARAPAEQIANVKRKSAMKEVYRSAGVRGRPRALVRNPRGGARLVAEPATGGRQARRGRGPRRPRSRFRNDGRTLLLLRMKPPVDYIVEEFIQGKIFSFDGLGNRDGNLVFFTSHAFSQGSWKR